MAPLELSAPANARRSVRGTSSEPAVMSVPMSLCVACFGNTPLGVSPPLIDNKRLRLLLSEPEDGSVLAIVRVPPSSTPYVGAASSVVYVLVVLSHVA